MQKSFLAGLLCFVFQCSFGQNYHYVKKDGGNPLNAASNLILNNSASNGLPPYSYVWSNSDPSLASINGFLNPTLTGVKVGFVDVKYYVIDANGCRSLTSSLFNVEIIPALMKFEIPNAFIPTDMYLENKFLKAAFNSSVKRINYFRVFNRMGKLVYEIVNARYGK